MLIVKNLVKTFNDKKILNDVSLTVKPGEVAVLLGASGVGKSTLLRLLCNLESMEGGSIELDGTKVTPQSMVADHRIGMVFQQFNLFDHMTVEDNIIFPLQKVVKLSAQEARTQAHDLLKRYELLEKAAEYPAQLSGGQKQRLAIARALALKPTIICMDEPTSALDPLLTTYVANNIQKLAREGYTVLVASHDTLLLEKLSCTIYLMKDGKIIESGSSQELCSNKDICSRIASFTKGTVHQE